MSVGKKILTHVIKKARNKKIEKLYLLTTTAANFFNKQGWILINRKNVPEAVRQSKEFSEICPKNSDCMFIQLSNNEVKRSINSFLGDCNCSQAVFGTFSPQFGLNKNKAIKLAAGFGAGINYKSEICGAVTGAYMTIGLKYGLNKEKVREKIQEFDEEFIKKNDSIYCKQLLEYDLSKVDNLQKARELDLFKKICPNLIKDSGEILKELLNN